MRNRNGAVDYAQSITRNLLLCRAEAGRGAEIPRRGRSRNPQGLTRTGIPCAKQELLAGVVVRLMAGRGAPTRPLRVAVDAVFDSVSSQPHSSMSSRSRRHLHADLRSGPANIRIWCRNISAPWCRHRITSSPRSTRRCFPTAPSCMCRRACAADELSTYFRIMSAQRPIRAHPHHRRQGSYVSYLEGCTAPRRDRESAARRGGRADRA